MLALTHFRCKLHLVRVVVHRFCVATLLAARSYTRLRLDMPNPKTKSKVDEVKDLLAERVRMARAGKRLSQTEVAQRAGTSVARVSEIENCLADPRLSTVVRIAEALDIDVTIGSAA